MWVFFPLLNVVSCSIWYELCSTFQFSWKWCLIFSLFSSDQFCCSTFALNCGKYGVFSSSSIQRSIFRQDTRHKFLRVIKLSDKGTLDHVNISSTQSRQHSLIRYNSYLHKATKVVNYNYNSKIVMKNNLTQDLYQVYKAFYFDSLALVFQTSTPIDWNDKNSWNYKFIVSYNLPNSTLNGA